MNHARLLPIVLGACLLAGCASSVHDVTASITPSAPAATTATVALGPTEDPAIAIERPPDDGELSSPVSVTGTADVVGREVSVRILDRNGSELAAIEADVDCEDTCPGTFGTELFFFVERRQPGWVEVSGPTADGPAVSRVPVVLFPM